jgi:hypothetical protein
LPEITVCIPAYRAHAFIQHTLSSVQHQTLTDFVVEIGIEPPDAELTLAACGPFLGDPRFRADVNSDLLGYSANVGALMGRVRTPLFVVLPHDDLWHPRFLERLHDRLDGRPDAVCAYPDLYCFARDGVGAGIMSHPVPDAGVAERVLGWLLDGASGNLWHGLTRSTVLGKPYPDNAYRAFAAEVEWAGHLIGQGAVLRVAEALYFKRIPGAATPDSASAAWFRRAADLPAALEHHRRQVIAAIPPGLSMLDREAATAAAEAAMLRRWTEWADGRWGLTDSQLERCGVLLTGALLRPEVASRIAATVRWCLSRHRQTQGDLERAEQEVREGLAIDPAHAMLNVQLGWLQLARGRALDALETSVRASHAHPDDWAVRHLRRHCDIRFDEDVRPLEAGLMSNVPTPSATA